MIKLYKKESGSTALIGFFIAVLIVAAAGFGWYVGDSNKSDDPIVNNTTNSSKSDDAKSSSEGANNTIKLGALNYDFSAPTEWRTTSGNSPAGVYSDDKGNSLTIGQDVAYGQIEAEYLWVVESTTNGHGIRVVEKSPECASPGQTTFKGVSYICKPSATSTRIAAVTTAPGGEIPVGSHKYTIVFGNDKTSSSDTITFEAMLNTFKSTP